MWGSLFNFDETMRKRFAKHSMIAGVFFILAGIAGIVYPQMMSLVTLYFIGWILLFAGLVAGYATFMTDRSSWMGWLKSVVLIITGFLLFLLPDSGVAALGLLLAFYFLLDGFSSFGIGFSMPKGKWLWFLNAFFSIVLAVIFLIGWPFTSFWLVGLFVGISLLMDGFVLLGLGASLRSHTEQ